MTGPDYFVLMLYAVGLFVISTVSSKRNVNQKEMFSANRSSPWWASGLSGFMTVFSAATFVVWGGIAYEQGIVAVAINTCYGIAAMGVGYFVAGRWNKMGLSTPAEYVQVRFGNLGLHFFTWTMLIKRILGVAVSLYAVAKIVVAIDPVNLFGLSPLNTMIILFGVIIVLYTMQGGLWAVLMTDVLQFIVLTVVVMITAFIMLSDIGSFSAFAETVPADFFSPTADKYGWLFLTGWVIINFFVIGVEWAFVQRYLSVKSPKDARKGTYLFAVMYLITPLFWLLPPLLYRGQVEGLDKEQAYILAAQATLPPGIMGLMVAAMFSATASMVSSQLNVIAGVLTNDFYKAFFRPNASEKNLVFTGRVFTVILGTALTICALCVPYMGGATKVILSINSLLVVPLFAPTLWGVFSHKIGIKQMAIVVGISFSIGFTLMFGIAQNPLITEESSLYGFAQYLLKNKTNVEVIIGVLMPLVILTFMEFTLKKTDPRSLDIDKMIEREAQEIEEVQNHKRPFDILPALMVMWSLFIIGSWLIFISLREAQGKTIIMTTGIILVISGVIVKIVANKLQKASDLEQTKPQSEL